MNLADVIGIDLEDAGLNEIFHSHIREAGCFHFGHELGGDLEDRRFEKIIDVQRPKVSALEVVGEFSGHPDRRRGEQPVLEIVAPASFARRLLKVESAALHRRNETHVRREPERAGTFTVHKSPFALDGSGFAYQAERYFAVLRLFASKALKVSEIERGTLLRLAAFASAFERK